jgi:hypothetical protein
MKRIATPTFLAVIALVAACSDAPRSVPTSKSSGGQTGMGATKPGDLPPNHPPIDGASGGASNEHSDATDPNAEFTGKVVLTGALAKAKTGAVFISVGPAGQRIVYISYKIDLADPKAAPPLVVDLPDGSREIHFVLNSRTSMMGGEVQTGVELELKAKYSPTGFVDPTPGIVETAVPTKIGATDVVLTLHS